MKLNQGYCYRIQLNKDAKGHTVQSYLCERYAHSTPAQWQQRIRSGEVKVDGKSVSEACSLVTGCVLTWDRPAWLEEETPQTFDTVFLDDDLLVVSKPSGLPTLPGGGFYLNTLLTLVQREFPSASPMHRLGRGTSGLVVFACHPVAARTITKHWAKTEKRYRALGKHIAANDEYDIRTPIGKIPHPKLGTVHAAVVKGKAAHSTARTLQRRVDSTLFDVELHTGRAHQIRIHLAAVGHPLLGDPMYTSGGGLCPDPGLPGDLGYLLHAHRITLEHPTNARQLQLEAEPPDSLRV